MLGVALAGQRHVQWRNLCRQLRHKLLELLDDLVFRVHVRTLTKFPEPIQEHFDPVNSYNLTNHGEMGDLTSFIHGTNVARSGFRILTPTLTVLVAPTRAACRKTPTNKEIGNCFCGLLEQSSLPSNTIVR